MDKKAMVYAIFLALTHATLLSAGFSQSYIRYNLAKGCAQVQRVLRCCTTPSSTATTVICTDPLNEYGDCNSTDIEAPVCCVYPNKDCVGPHISCDRGPSDLSKVCAKRGRVVRCCITPIPRAVLYCSDPRDNRTGACYNPQEEAPHCCTYCNGETSNCIDPN